MTDNDRTSHDLEVISSRSGREEGEKRHLPRLRLTSEQFRLSRPNKVFSVTDLSDKGMGFWLLDADDRALFVVGALLEGLLNLAGEKHPVRARVRNISRDRVGCEFEDLLDTTQKGIAKFLDPTTLGAELRPIPSAEAGTLWYHGPSGTDLLLKRKTDGQFDQLCLYFLERFVRWDTEEGLVTGTSEASSEPCEIRGILRLETLLLHLDSSQDSDKLRIAKTIILSSNLSQDLKSWCVRQLER